MKKKTKAVKKVIRRRRRKTIKAVGNPAITSDLEQFYKIINKVQIGNETVNLMVYAIESAVYDNILKDLELIVSKTEKKFEDIDVVEYKVSPNPKKDDDDVDFENMESLPDEFFEDGQLFGI